MKLPVLGFSISFKQKMDSSVFCIQENGQEEDQESDAADRREV